MSPDDVFAAQMWPWPDPLLKRDPSGRVIFVNAAFLALYGGRVENWTGNPVQGWPAPTGPGQPYRFETRAGVAPQETIYDWVEVTLADGNALAVARDVTVFQAQAIAQPAPADTNHTADIHHNASAQIAAEQAEAERQAQAQAQIQAQAQAEAQAQIQAQVQAEMQAQAAAMAAQAAAPNIAPALSAPEPQNDTQAPAAYEAPMAYEPEPSHMPAPSLEPSLHPTETMQPSQAQSTVQDMAPAPQVAAQTPIQTPEERLDIRIPEPEPEQQPERDFERRALPLEDDNAVLGSNWRDAVIARAVGSAMPNAEVEAPEPKVAAQTPAQPESPMQSLRVLLAEDNAINALLTRTLLEADGCVVETVEDGQLAVEAVKNNSYDLVLMDMRMPNMDGLEATRKIRAMGARTEKLPIIALTANAFDDDRNACFDSGMNDFMTKPVSAEELSAMVTNWMNKARDEAA